MQPLWEPRRRSASLPRVLLPPSRPSRARGTVVLHLRLEKALACSERLLKAPERCLFNPQHLRLGVGLGLRPSIIHGSSPPCSAASHPRSAAAPHAGTLCARLPARGDSIPPPPDRRGRMSGPESCTHFLWQRESRGRRRDLGAVGVRVRRQPRRRQPPGRPEELSCRRARGGRGSPPALQTALFPLSPPKTKEGRAPTGASRAPVLARKATQSSAPLTLRAVGCAELPRHQRGRNGTVPSRRAGKSRREGPARAETPASPLSHPSVCASRVGFGARGSPLLPAPC